MKRIICIMMLICYLMLIGCSAQSAVPSCSSKEAKEFIKREARMKMGTDIFKQKMIEGKFFNNVLMMTFEEASNSKDITDPAIIEIINETWEEVHIPKLEVVNIRTNFSSEEAQAVHCTCQIYVNDKPINNDIIYEIQMTSDGKMMGKIR